METVTVTRTIAAAPSAVRDAITDLEPFMRAAGFDEVAVEGDLIHLTNRVGIAEIELTVERVDAPDAVLAYEQREGIFASMRTDYRVEEVDADGEQGTRIEATTDFELDVALVGDLLDATVIRRQRRKELDAQFDYLESVTE
ncbi:MAG: SRPBCC family protein [Haloplanus sp.]